MKRYFKNFPFSMFIVSLLCMGLGLAVLLWPGAAVKVLCYGLGAVLIVAALVQGGAFLAREENGPLRSLMLLSAFISAVLGVWVLLSPDKVQTLAMIVMGVVLLYHGVMDVKYGLDVRAGGSKSWTAVLLFGLATCGVGVLMLVNPFEKVETLFFTAGLGFLFDGITDLFTVFALTRTRVKAEQLAAAEPVVEIPSAGAEELPPKEKKPPKARARAKKPAQSAPPAKKPAQSAPPAEKPAQSAPPAEKPAQSAAPAEPPAQSATPAEPPAQSAPPAEKPTEAPPITVVAAPPLEGPERPEGKSEKPEQ